MKKSGPITRTKLLTRRQFVNRSVLAGAGVGILAYSSIELKKYINSNVADGSDIKVTCHNLASKGHRIKENKNEDLQKNSTVEEVDVAIIGAGISGLSVGHFLKKSGFENFKIYEMNSAAGGNSEYFSSPYGRASWGGHYLPIIRNDDDLLKEFLTDHNIIVGEANGLPIYNEEYLCQDPHERLLVRGHWQDSLIPDFGLDEVSKNEIRQFHEFTNELKNKKGTDGLSLFSIPIDRSSKDPEFLKLDQISFKDFLIQKKWNSEAMHWYANYACQDDFGTSFENTSAWAGLHYFSARNGKAANTEEQSVITWPEGNGFLSECLQKNIRDKIRLNSSVQKIEKLNSSYKIRIEELAMNTFYQVNAKKVVYCLPRFTTPYLIANSPKLNFLNYNPWLIAHIAIERSCLEKNHHLSWDTVKFLEKDLGYINNHHQYLTQNREDILITFYFAFTEDQAMRSRQTLANWNDEKAKEFIISQLQKYHPDIAGSIKTIDYRILGHGMISPSINFLWNQRVTDMPREQDGILFAHTDMSGISIFEEGFHQGHKTFLKLKEYL